MKSTIVMLSLIVSANLFASGDTSPFAMSSFGTVIYLGTTFASTTGPVFRHKLQAQAVINDAQEMMQTGSISLLLSEKIQEAQNLNDGLSESEALDVLIEAAEKALAN